ncbi:MAG: T9SS type A sorting domain-containing protein [Flavobacteriales bacterium]|nr:T9SS type A sorting domain-containing protein [Flavobacteriales bacterium]
MKNFRTLGLVSLIAILGVATYVHLDHQMRYQPRSEQGSGEYIKGAQEYLSMLRANVVTGQVEPEDHRRMGEAVRYYASMQPKSVSSEWVEMGPDNVGGRVRSIVYDPNNFQSLWTGGVSGGLWHTTDGGNLWEKVESFSDNLCISSIALLGNGHLLVATGSTFERPFGTGGSGFVGGGLFRSTDGGASFELLEGPTTNWSASSPWAIIDKLVADPVDPNKCWVAYNKGLKIYDSGSNTMSDPPGSVPSNVLCKALEVSNDGQLIIADFGSGVYISRDGGNTFDQIQGNGFPSAAQYGRIEIAISPDNKDYIYVMGESNGRMFGVFSSTDQGYNWTRIWPAGFGTNGVPELDIFGDNSQGFYDNILAVAPGQPDRLWLGGVTLWSTSLNAQPVQIALGFDFTGCFNCVHADIHEITFTPDGTAYIGCDGGIYVSPPGALSGQIFYAANRGLNITQFYSLAYSAKGKVLGGTQDNGTQYLPGVGGNTPLEAVELTGGDGFDSEISQIDGNIMFTTLYFGGLFRTADGGSNFSDFYDSRVTALGAPGDLQNGLGDFYTDIALYENWNDTGSQDSLTWINNTGDTLFFGETVYYVGRMPQVSQSFTVTQAFIAPEDSVRVQDKVQTLLAVGFAGGEGVWVTRDACQFIDGVQWMKVANNAMGNVNVLEWSADGDHLFWGTSDGNVYRLSGFNNVYSFDQGDVLLGTDYSLDGPTPIMTGGSVITGLSSDPSDPSRLLVSTGGYGGSNKVRLITNATTTPAVGNLWNVPLELTGMPVYDCLIHATNNDIMFVGTEWGVMGTDDGGASWTFQTNGMPRVPVFALRQQTWTWDSNPYGPDYVTNPYVIYAGTHGRGAFKTETFLSLPPSPSSTGSNEESGLAVSVFPNPVAMDATVAFSLDGRNDVSITIYDMKGSVVRNERPTSYGPGEHRVTMNVADLLNGTYMVEVRAEGKRSVGRFVVSR